ncbi:Cof-type HAD-IIB family hydrolase [Vagococcus sp. BWB3-3]|uniref:Cof-type HAD-IIB family hydrolase n=1 Tax=Vagococcus allomyrinae TaxID=2794353 RepID=A0A940P8S5_9ENTE|nr:Cof-type HAD-IIB family hydrolase [Vagococcus allomyrinae]MBP1043819.1 Cof-type HAD-IIB family hydrolase [Vagococcus allomyrinae]
MTEVKGLAFFDLDGTLLDEHSDVTIEIIEAMIELQENKIIPVIATGRTNTEVREISQRTGIDSLITMNGQYVLFEGKEVYSGLIPQDICEKMYHQTQALGQEIGFYTPDLITVSQHTPMVEKTYNYIHSPLPIVNSQLYRERDLNMLLVIGEEHDDVYKENFPELTFFRNGPHSIDVISKGGNKGKGVRELVKALGLEGVPTYGFGDGLNDIDLLKACDHRIAMGNAKPELKEIATYITTKNTEGGILRALRQYNLIY